MDPTQLLSIYSKVSRIPGGRTLFSKIVGRAARYTGSIPFKVEALERGYARVRMKDTPAVRNHLRSVHAIALMNLGEVCTGLAAYSAMPPGARGIPTNLSMTYVKKSRGTITAECHAELPTESGQHDAVVEGILRDASGDEVARMHATWRLELP